MAIIEYTVLMTSTLMCPLWVLLLFKMDQRSLLLNITAKSTSFKSRTKNSLCLFPTTRGILIRSSIWFQNYWIWLVWRTTNEEISVWWRMLPNSQSWNQNKEIKKLWRCKDCSKLSLKRGIFKWVTTNGLVASNWILRQLN